MLHKFDFMGKIFTQGEYQRYKTKMAFLRVQTTFSNEFSNAVSAIAGYGNWMQIDKNGDLVMVEGRDGDRRGLVIDLDTKCIVAREPPQVYEQNVHNILESVNSGDFYPCFDAVNLRVYKHKGKIYASTRRRIDSGLSKWGNMPTFGDLLTQHFPNLDVLFPTEKEQDYIYFFLLIDPHLSLNSSIWDRRLILLGVEDRNTGKSVEPAVSCDEPEPDVFTDTIRPLRRACKLTREQVAQLLTPVENTTDERMGENEFRLEYVKTDQGYQIGKIWYKGFEHKDSWNPVGEAVINIVDGTIYKYYEHGYQERMSLTCNNPAVLDQLAKIAVVQNLGCRISNENKNLAKFKGNFAQKYYTLCLPSFRRQQLGDFESVFAQQKKDLKAFIADEWKDLDRTHYAFTTTFCKDKETADKWELLASGQKTVDTMNQVEIKKFAQQLKTYRVRIAKANSSKTE